MNQTVTANISGIVFHIEVGAYEQLKNYLNKIRSYFNNSEECDEIMADIEARIAELFSIKITPINQVICGKDVEEVITIMGKPEQYIDKEEEETFKDTKPPLRNYSTAKKLFRDPDQRIIGGVASGIASYFGVDSIWVRLFFILLFFIGFGPLFYIILWAVIPEAKTASDKLKMKGEPVNIDNIGKTIEYEANRVSEKFNSENTTKYVKQAETAFEAFFNFLTQLLKGFFNVFGKVFGVVFLLIGFVLLISITLWLTVGNEMIFSITNQGVFSAVQSSELFNLIFESTEQYHLFLIGFSLAILIPILVIIYSGLKLLFNVKTHFNVGLSLFILWVFGLVICLFLGFTVAKDQVIDGQIKKEIKLPSISNNYNITANEGYMPGKNILESFDLNISTDESYIYNNDVHFDIEKSKNEEASIRITFKSSGHSKKEAIENAKSINYHYVVKDNSININSYLSLPIKDKLRSQKVLITLYLPINKTIFLDNSLEGIIYDIDNVTDAYDHDMLGEKWIMLENGLTCFDCDEIEGITSSKLDSIRATITVKEDEEFEK
jgi:phage shock protein PspC (stress-responsive transcriptional regulator)